MKFLSVLAIVFASASQTDAGIHLEFLEGAPKDRFVLTNESSCQVKNALVTIDLSASTYGLIFDVTASGSGVEVFQPFELTSGAKHILTLPEISDGDQSVTLQLQNFGPSNVVAFTIDVDKTSGAREITVSDSEVQGVAVYVNIDERIVSANFKDSPEVRLDLGGCLE